MLPSKEPNLFIIGFQKCATSTLFEYLIRHPQITGTSPKETYYLVDDEFELFNPNMNISTPNTSWDDFLTNDLRNIKYILEGSVCNFYQKRAIKNISINKQNKVIFVVRDPIDRFVSTYKYFSNYLLKFHGEITINQYYELVKEGEIKKEACKYAIEHGHYVKYISPWIEKLGTHRVLILGMNDILNNTNEFAGKLKRFLDIDISEIGSVGHENFSRAHLFPQLHKIVLDNFGGYDFPGKKYIIQFYRSLFYQRNRGVEISHELRDKLTDEYFEEYSYFYSYF